MDTFKNLNLVISCFVTHQRSKVQKSRIKQFLATLHSYSRIKWNNVYLFIKLDVDVAHYKYEVEYFVRSSFDFQSLEIKFDRIISKKEWQIFFSNKTTGDALWWFTQNDDHAYLNSDSSYFNDLLYILSEKKEPSSIFLSHWPEILRVGSNQNECLITDKYIEFKGLILDSIQIFNNQMINYIFFEKEWPRDNMNRIDTIALSDNFILNGLSCSEHIQMIIVPLKELCRKFIGYDHVKLNFSAELTTISTVRPVSYDNNDLLKYITASHFSEWTKRNPQQITSELINLILYKNNENIKKVISNVNISLYKKLFNWFFERTFYFRNILVVLRNNVNLIITFIKSVIKLIIRKK